MWTTILDSYLESMSAVPFTRFGRGLSNSGTQISPMIVDFKIQGDVGAAFSKAIRLPSAYPAPKTQRRLLYDFMVFSLDVT
jgi:hypothetical protein